MGLSDATWFAATVAILLGIYIGERILDIEFFCFSGKNRKKGKNKKNDGTARRYHSSKVRDTP